MDPTTGGGRLLICPSSSCLFCPVSFRDVARATGQEYFHNIVSLIPCIFFDVLRHIQPKMTDRCVSV